MYALRRAVQIGALILAGETIYLLPFALRREYENPLLDATGLSNTELGWVKLALGLFAVVCYFPGGWLADRFSARRLLTISLLSTGLGGLYMLTMPGFYGLMALYAFWGISSILTFWGALIKATRTWGGHSEQGRAFGLLEGGRGFVGAGLPSIGLIGFALFESSRAGLQAVIMLYSIVVLITGALTWLVLPEGSESSDSPNPAADSESASTARADNPVLAVLKMPAVWLMAVVIFTGYLGYLGTFNLAKFAQDAYGMSDVGGAQVSLVGMWSRAGAALAAGFLADRFGPSRTVFASFVLLVSAYVAFATLPATDATTWLLWSNAAIIAIAAGSLRGVFFALLQEGGVPAALTGTAVGLVSFVGYTPDVFTGLLKGALLDAFPGSLGHQYFFGILAAAGIVGCGAALGIRWLAASAPDPEPIARSETS